MNRMQKVGGIAAIVEATTFLFGFALLVTTLAPMVDGTLDYAERVRFLADHAALTYVWNLVIYVVFGLVLIVLVYALRERLTGQAPALMQIATAIGLIWAGLVIAAGMLANVGAAAVIRMLESAPEHATAVWIAVNTVQNGLGGGNEIVGGIWVILVSLSAFRADLLPRALNYLGLVSGGAGVVTVVPALTEVGAIFGIGLIAWFIWLGIVLIGRGGTR
jgi:hypothetical protein